MQRPQDAALDRHRPFDRARTCLLLIDTQNYVWNDEVGTAKLMWLRGRANEVG